MHRSSRSWFVALALGACAPVERREERPLAPPSAAVEVGRPPAPAPAAADSKPPALASSGPHADPASAASDARSLFLANCASCHGETGDGQGWTKLDRPARSFMDGGFSFGNTPEQLFRTLTTGIPGTPMPAFDVSLSDEERRVLADYVITLGPPVEEMDLSKSVLIVGDEPLVVRGMLPPIVEGAHSWPRGLIVGTTDGLSFEYRADDVRLIGVRQGGFVQRKDWTGRGGDALEPLGKTIASAPQGDPGPVAILGVSDVPLVARLSSTAVLDGRARVRYELVDPSGRALASVEESAAAASTALGPGIRRRFDVTARAALSDLVLHVFDLPVRGAEAEITTGRSAKTMDPSSIVRWPDGVRDVVGVSTARSTVDFSLSNWRAAVRLDLGAGESTSLVATFVSVVDPSVDLTKGVLAEWNR
jgi:mono/diheme cytochrome c family protein